MLKNKDGFQVNISLSIFFIAFCDLFTDFPTYIVYVTLLKINWVETSVSIYLTTRLNIPADSHL
jgi:hypothetical protein